MANPRAGLQRMSGGSRPFNGGYMGAGGGGFANFGPMYNTPINPQFQDAANVFLQNSGTGLQMPSSDQINPYLFFGNNGFMQDHPKFASALDNGLSGLAFTAPSSTPGQAMNSIAQGILGSRQAHIGNIANQYMMPLAMAGQLQGLQAGQQALDLSKAQGEYYRGRAQYYANGGRPAGAKPEYTHYFERPDGVYGVTMQGDAEKIDGVPGKSAGMAGKTLPERLASVAGYDPEDDPDGYVGAVKGIAASIAGGNAGAGANAKKNVDLANGGVSEADKLDFELDKGNLHQSLLDPKDIMSNITAKQAGFKTPKAYNDKLISDFKEKHATILGSGPIAKQGAAAKPSAVAPPSGSPAPAASPKSSMPTVKLNKDGSFTIG